MKVLPTLLSCLIMAAVTLPHSGAAWSDTPAKPTAVKASGKPVLKKTPAKKTKAASGKKTSKVRAQVASKPQVVAEKVPVALNPYLPDTPGTVPAGPNPYLANAVAPTAGALNGSLPLVATTTLALPAVATVLPAPAAEPLSEQAPPSVAPVAVAPPHATSEISTPVQAEVLPTPTAQAVIVATPQPVMVAQPPMVVAVPRPASAPQTYINPYLANTQAFYQTPGTASAYSAPSLPNFPAMPSLLGLPEMSSLPGMPSISLSPDLDKLWYEIRSFLPDPHMPTLDMDILPSITKVLPTGEKPLYVLTFKCPTELIGITPLPTRALRWLITSGMEAANSTDLLPFNMQQVCQ